MGSTLLAALLGGVVGGGLVWFLSGIIGPDDDVTAQVEALRAQLASLETAEPVAPLDLGPLETRFTALEDQVAGLPTAMPDDGAAAVLAEDVETLRADLQAQAAALQAQARQVEALAVAPTGGGPDSVSNEALAGLADRIAATDARVAQLAGEAGATTAATDPALVERIDALETAVAGLPGQNAVAAATADLASSEELASIQTRLDELSSAVETAQNDEVASRIDALTTEAEQARTDLEGRLDDIASRLDDVSSQLSTLSDEATTLAATDESLRGSMETLRERFAELDDTLSDTSTRLDDVAARIDAPGERERAVAAVALAGLQGAIDRGTAYDTYLDTLETSGVVPRRQPGAAA